MLTAGLIVAVLLLLVALGVACLLWRAAVIEVAELDELTRAQLAELALSITGPPIDTRTGSHDALPIRDDIRATLTAYCEGMWQHTPNNNRDN